MRTVLIVDDQELVREFTAHALSCYGFQALEASNAEHALSLYAAHSAEIDLVLTDIVMPGLFGDQLALRLWEFDSNLPIIFMSGNPPNALEPGVSLQPGVNFIGNPFELPS